MFTSFFSCNSQSTSAAQDSIRIVQNFDSTEMSRYLRHYQDGRETFVQFCATCHVPPDKLKYDDQTFSNLFERLPTPGEDYLSRFIRKQDSLRAAGDRYTAVLDKIWPTHYVHHFDDSLTLTDLSHLILYIEIAPRIRQ